MLATLLQFVVSCQTHTGELRLLSRPYLNKSKVLILQNWRESDLNIDFLDRFPVFLVPVGTTTASAFLA